MNFKLGSVRTQRKRRWFDEYM